VLVLVLVLVSTMTITSTVLIPWGGDAMIKTQNTPHETDNVYGSTASRRMNDAG
jgi:hypothetical protein